jgi:hypothetical protein
MDAPLRPPLQAHVVVTVEQAGRDPLELDRPRRCEDLSERGLGRQNEIDAPGLQAQRIFDPEFEVGETLLPVAGKPLAVVVSFEGRESLREGASDRLLSGCRSSADENQHDHLLSRNASNPRR